MNLQKRSGVPELALSLAELAIKDAFGPFSDSFAFLNFIMAYSGRCTKQSSRRLDFCCFPFSSFLGEAKIEDFNEVARVVEPLKERLQMEQTARIHFDQGSVLMASSWQVLLSKPMI